MLRAKAAVLVAIILVAVIVAYHWRKGAGAVVVPVALLASYAVLRWQRDDCPGATRSALCYPPMLGPLDWYSAIKICIAAAIVGIIALIAWWQGPPRG